MLSPRQRKGCEYLGRVPANIKFPPHQILDDGSYLSWINPDRKSKKKGANKIQVRVIEYTIETDGEAKTYRLITSLMDLTRFPALLLPQQYHQRWEIENTIDELKTHLLGPKTPIRSLKPLKLIPRLKDVGFHVHRSWFIVHCNQLSTINYQQSDGRLSLLLLVEVGGIVAFCEVIQEIYGWLLGHYAIRSLMFQAAQTASISPLCLGFTGTLKVIGRAIGDFQDLTPEQLPFFSHG